MSVEILFRSLPLSNACRSSFTLGAQVKNDNSYLTPAVRHPRLFPVIRTANELWYVQEETVTSAGRIEPMPRDVSHNFQFFFTSSFLTNVNLFVPILENQLPSGKSVVPNPIVGFLIKKARSDREIEDQQIDFSLPCLHLFIYYNRCHVAVTRQLTIEPIVVT